jgi:hypothetical protein
MNYKSSFIFRDKEWFERHIDPELRREFARGLSSEECLLIIRVFTHCQNLVSEEIDVLRPIIIAAFESYASWMIGGTFLHQHL